MSVPVSINSRPQQPTTSPYNPVCSMRGPDSRTSKRDEKHGATITRAVRPPSCKQVYPGTNSGQALKCQDPLRFALGCWAISTMPEIFCTTSYAHNSLRSLLRPLSCPGHQVRPMSPRLVADRHLRWRTTACLGPTSILDVSLSNAYTYGTDD